MFGTDTLDYPYKLDVTLTSVTPNYRIIQSFGYGALVNFTDLITCPTLPTRAPTSTTQYSDIANTLSTSTVLVTGSSTAVFSKYGRISLVASGPTYIFISWNPPSTLPQSPRPLYQVWMVYCPRRNSLDAPPSYPPNLSLDQLSSLRSPCPGNEPQRIDDGDQIVLFHRRGDLIPGSDYLFQYRFMSIVSLWTLVRTNETKPSGLETPVVYQVTSACVGLNWSLPAIPNGVITHFVLYQTLSSETVVDRRFMATSHRFCELEQATRYSFRVEAYNR